MLDPWKKSYGYPRQHIKKQRHYSADKVLSSQSYGFSSSHEWLWGLDYKEIWALKNWCFWTVFWWRLVECKEIQPVNPKENFPEYSLEGPILWPPDAKNWLIGKDPDAGKDWRQEEKGTKEDEMVGRHHQLDGHEFEQAPGVHNGQGNLACCSTWDHKETDFLSNWTELNPICDNAYA